MQKQIENFPFPDYKMDFSEGAKIMGIVNVTPDSFYDGGKYSHSVDATIQHALKQIDDGADILDIGGESSRPGAEPVTEAEETDRLIPVIEAIRKISNIPISVDTYKSSVAKFAMNAGANWINDISGLRFDENLIEIAAEYNCPVIVMHMQGTPRSMQLNPKYDDVVSKITDFFYERIEYLNQNNISKIVIDPGIGFGKTQSHNLQILNRVEEFRQFGFPILIGVSRKSFIGSILNNNVDQRLAGSLAALSWLLINKTDIIRVHDVKESVETRKLMYSIINIKNVHF